MTLYIISGDKITAHEEVPARTPKAAAIIRTIGDLEALPASRLVGLWNARPGVAEVTRFKDRKTGARRLWEELQKLKRQGAKTKAKSEAPALTKLARVIALLQRSEGATLDEIVKATDWQRHSIRGLISGSIKKAMGMNVSSAREERGRVYRVTGGGDA